MLVTEEVTTPPSPAPGVLFTEEVTSPPSPGPGVLLMEEVTNPPSRVVELTDVFGSLITEGIRVPDKTPTSRLGPPSYRVTGGLRQEGPFPVFNPAVVPTLPVLSGPPGKPTIVRSRLRRRDNHGLSRKNVFLVNVSSGFLNQGFTCALTLPPGLAVGPLDSGSWWFLELETLLVGRVPTSRASTFPPRLATPTWRPTKGSDTSGDGD